MKVKPMAKEFTCESNDREVRCKLRVSVRNWSVAILIKPEHEWPHLTIEQAEEVGNYLLQAAAEARYRKQQERAETAKAVERIMNVKN